MANLFRCGGGQPTLSWAALNYRQDIATLSVCFKTEGLTTVRFRVTRPAYGGFRVGGTQVVDTAYGGGTHLSNTSGTMTNTEVIVNVTGYKYINVSVALGGGADDTWSLISVE